VSVCGGVAARAHAHEQGRDVQQHPRFIPPPPSRHTLHTHHLVRQDAVEVVVVQRHHPLEPHHLRVCVRAYWGMFLVCWLVGQSKDEVAEHTASRGRQVRTHTQRSHPCTHAPTAVLWSRAHVAQKHVQQCPGPTRTWNSRSKSRGMIKRTHLTLNTLAANTPSLEARAPGTPAARPRAGAAGGRVGG